ncbi:MAG: hypothetical protein H0W62_02895 [Chitinophagales bacterium]|nr:hypothetical protein [Chitinophagales bacterium]
MKKVFRYPVLCITFIIFHFCSIAQFHFVPALVWLSNGDTLKGWVNDRGWTKIPGHIRFKQDPHDPESIFYFPANIAGFTVNNKEAFVSYVGNIDSAHAVVRHTSTAIKPRGILDSLFLKPLVNGRVSLFFSIDKRGVMHYFIKAWNRPIEELHFFEFIFYEKGINKGIFESVTMHVIQQNQYKQQLLVSFADCQAIYVHLATSKTHFTRHNLKKWCLEYNQQCVE